MAEVRIEAVQKPPVVVVTGPTASSKTEVAIQLALRFEGEVVNADSMQVYRYLDIGTAKPSLEQRGRVAHHLYDVALPDDRYDAGRYAQEARSVAAKLHGRNKLVILAGGTGLYIRAFLEGLIQGGGADLELRERLERQDRAARGAGDPCWLHRQLTERDPESAARIHPNDVRRLVRALELCERHGGPVSRLQRAQAFSEQPYRVLHLALDPGTAELDARIDARCVAMLKAGLLQEVRGLRDRGYGFELRPLQAIGYRHMAAVEAGSDTLENALVAMQRDTRRFARRQRTWLRGVADAQWMNPDQPETILRAVEAFLNE